MPLPINNPVGTLKYICKNTCLTMKLRDSLLKNNHHTNFLNRTLLNNILKNTTMKNKVKVNAKVSVNGYFYGKRDYYFHADEDFREDRDWGKAKSTDVPKINTSNNKSTLSS
jgi:hypothetical protein